MTAYTHILDFAKEADPPAGGVLGRTIDLDDRIKAVVFGVGQGQELSEHRAGKPAMLFFVKGEATVGLGDDTQDAQAGTWIWNAPRSCTRCCGSTGWESNPAIGCQSEGIAVDVAGAVNSGANSHEAR